MSGIPDPPLKLRANNPASYAGYDDLRTLQHQMFRHLLPKIPEEVPIISEDYQMSQYEARNWRDLVSFLLRAHTQHLAPFTAGVFCLESELHFSRNW